MEFLGSEGGERFGMVLLGRASRCFLFAAFIVVSVTFAASEAATLWACGADIGSGNCLSEGDACDLQQAINTASAGDTINVDHDCGTIFTSITYQIAGSANHGTSGSKITLQGTGTGVPQALIKGNDSSSSSNLCINLDRQWWVIKNLRIINCGRGIDVNDPNNEIFDNIITSYPGISGFPHSYGISCFQSSTNIHHNVIGGNDILESYGSEQIGIIVQGSCQAPTIDSNALYSNQANEFLTDNPDGTHITGSAGLNAGTARGNVMLGPGDKEMFRAGFQSSDWLYDSNITVGGPSGGWGFRDEVSSSANNNTGQNNLCVDMATCMGVKGNQNGSNNYFHNTIIQGILSREGRRSEQDDGGLGTEYGDEEALFVSNLLYSPTSANGQSLEHDNFTGDGMPILDFVIKYNDVHPGGDADKHHNLYWGDYLEAPSGNKSGWNINNDGTYPFAATDIHDRSTGRPTFVNEANGDFSLASGSVGENAAHDSTDIGIAYNTYLTRRLAILAYKMIKNETFEATSGTSHAMSLASGRYSVYARVPESGYHTGTQLFNTEGTNFGTTHDFNAMFNTPLGLRGGFTMFRFNAKQRWVWIGDREVSDGTLNVSWGNSNAVNAIIARPYPIANEMYVWMRPEQFPLTIASAEVKLATPSVVEITVTLPSIDGVAEAVTVDSAGAGLSFTKNAVSWPVTSCTAATASRVDCTMATPAVQGDSLLLNNSPPGTLTTGVLLAQVLIEAGSETNFSITNNAPADGGGSPGPGIFSGATFSGGSRQ